MFPRIAFFISAIILSSIALKIPDISEVDVLRYQFIDLENNIWKLIKKHQYKNDRARDKFRIKLINKYRSFSDKITKQISLDTAYGVETLGHQTIWVRTYKEIQIVDKMFEFFRKFLKSQSQGSKVPSLWRSMIVMHKRGKRAHEALWTIRLLVQEKMLFHETLKSAIVEVCQIKKSVHKFIYDIYNLIALTQLKGYIIMQFCRQGFRLVLRGTKSAEAELTKTTYYRSSLITAEAVKTVMDKINRDLWKCNPKENILGKTYTELTKLMQGYIENEVNLSHDSCAENCAYYKDRNIAGCHDGYCLRRPACNGRILNCKYLGFYYEICPAAPNSKKRYDYFIVDGILYATNTDGCHYNLIRQYTWRRFVYTCDYCFCICDEEYRSDRYFNLREYVSDTKTNKVVTGLRFTKKNGVIHVQLQEGTLLPYGRIDESTLSWKPVDEYEYNDRNIKNGIDTHKMDADNRNIALVDLILKDNYLVTGVRFRVKKSNLILEIRATPFNFSSGLLIKPKLESFWHRTNKSAKIKEEVFGKRRFPSPTVKDYANNRYIQFRSSLYLDAAQRTIPPIDIQDVVPDIATPLSGAGIYYKAYAKHLGTLGLKTMSYDFGKHIKVVFPAERRQP